TLAPIRDGFTPMWDTPGAASVNAAQWDGFRHDRQRTGARESGVPAGLVPPGCQAGVYPLDLKATRIRNRTAPVTDTVRVRGLFRLAGNALDFASDPFELRITGAGAGDSGVAPSGLHAVPGGVPLSR